MYLVKVKASETYIIGMELLALGRGDFANGRIVFHGILVVVAEDTNIASTYNVGTIALVANIKQLILAGHELLGQSTLLPGGCLVLALVLLCRSISITQI